MCNGNEQTNFLFDFWWVYEQVKTFQNLLCHCLIIIVFFSCLCSRRRCLVSVVDSAAAPTCWIGVLQSRTGLRRAGTGRCYLPGRAAWWGIRVTSSTRISFGGYTMRQASTRGSRRPRRTYGAVSERRTSTSIATCVCCRTRGRIGVPGSSCRGYLTLACPICLLRFHLFGSAAPAEDLAAWDPDGLVIDYSILVILLVM